MKYRILSPDPETGKFTFTKEELETLLGEIYEEGYNDRAKSVCYTSMPTTFTSCSSKTNKV